MAIGREYIGHFIYVLHVLLPLVQITESLEIRGDQQIGRPLLQNLLCNRM